MKRRPVDDERITTFGRLVEAHARLEGVLGRSLQERHGLSHAEFEAMLRVARSGEGRLMMRELTVQLALTSGGVTRLVDRLETAGYVRRTAEPSDRRVQYVELTADGKRALDAAVATHLENLDEELFSRLTATDVARLDALLDKLR